MKGKYKLTRFARFVIFASILSSALYLAHPTIDNYIENGQVLKLKLGDREFVLGNQEFSDSERIELLHQEIELLNLEIEEKRKEILSIQEP